MKGRKLGIAIGLVGACLSSPATWASNGSNLNGWGTSARAYAGAGVALAEDPMVMANNPAGLVALSGRHFQIGATFLHSAQSFDATRVPLQMGMTPPGALTPQRREADPDVPAEIHDIFPVPFAALSWRLDDRNAVGLAIYGNGGININYKRFDNPSCPATTPQSGILCFGTTGSDIAQLFISPVYARQVNDWLRVGVAPLLVLQTVEIRGLRSLAPASSDPEHLTNEGHDLAVGYGVKLGVQAQILDNLAAGLTVQSRLYIDEHESYAGLLAEHGDLDGPAYFQVGLAWEPIENWTLLLDYQRIYFSEVAAFGNPTDAPAPTAGPEQLYGGDDGPGFGWDDIPMIKVGLRYQPSPHWVFRAGYADNSPPIEDEDALANFLSNAIYEEHFGAGLTWHPSPHNSFDLTLVVVPEQTSVAPNPRFPSQKIKQTNSITTVGLSWKRGF
ncbi:MAG: outer membrane protein transport protein [Sinobacteraceae bacterium]|nr:outer membrane protein transport protein [Nevskiaceae bacterium]